MNTAPHFLLLCLGGLVSLSATAATRTWPGPSPCNSTLQACINASAAADTVLVAQSAPIAESISINKPFVLRAMPGQRATLAAGFAIAGNVNAAGTWTWQIQDFNLEQGFIALSVGGGTQANVIVRNNRVAQAVSGAAQISLFKPSTISTTLNYELSGNQLNYFFDTFDGALRAALQVLDGGSGSSEGIIRDNRIIATGNESIGILVSTQDRTHRVGVAGNHVLGGRRGSIFLRQGSLVAAPSGSLTALITSNVVRSLVPGTRHADGIKVDVYDGVLDVDVAHNTVVDAFNGVDIFASDGTTASGSVDGNLFAYLSSSALQGSGAAAITDSSNLYFQTPETAATPGLNADSIFADPRLRSVTGDPRLRADSPAIDYAPPAALRSKLLAFSLPETDGDGLRRVKLANTVSKALPLDVGALEAGDNTFLHRVPASAPGNVSPLDDAAVNGFSGALPQVTAIWNPDGEVGIYNDHPVSLRYLSGTGRWQLRQEDLASFTPGARFSIFSPGGGIGRYLHQNTPDNTSGNLTTLDHPDLNNREDAIVLVIRNPGTGTVFDVVSPLAVNYFGGVWSVVRLDGFPMPESGGFNVYFQEPSIAAFRHVSSSANIFGNVTDIDHPLLNGRRCARMHVIQATDFGVSNNHDIGVYFEPSVQRWSIFNQDTSAMPAGVTFHVVIDAAASDCGGTLFSSGFESPG